MDGVRVLRRGQLEVVPRNSAAGGRPISTASAGGSLGRGSRALHLQHHQSSLSALHMTANHTGTVDRRRSSLRVMYRLDSRAWSAHICNQELDAAPRLARALSTLPPSPPTVP